MSSFKEFQDRFGRDWSQLIGTPAFGAALALAHGERIAKITILTDDEIAAHGAIILSDLRGHLQYENALLGLHEKKEFVFQALGAEEYPDPIDEARSENVDDGGSESYGGMYPPEALHEQLFPVPKRKRGRPPKKKENK